MSYSQNKEDLIALSYFGKDYKGTLLEIGANDGQTFSNSLLLIQHGWEAHLLEPASVCANLLNLHKGNDKVHIYNYGIGETECFASLYESGAHVHGGKDRALVSSCDYDETVRWRKAGVEFSEREIQLVPFDKFWKYADEPKFDYVSIDAEGKDKVILEQIDLIKIDCKMLCVEFNGNQFLNEFFTDYCYNYGFKLYHRNAENLIFCR